MQAKRLLVCDLDNTLYDWVGYFVPSFYSMIDTVVEITGCEREKLLDDFRAVHQKYGDSEQPFALLETDTVKKIYEGCSNNVIAKTLDPAFHEFNIARKNYLKTHRCVHSTLSAIKDSGITLVAHTESKLFGAADRLQRLKLVDYFSRVYCRERSASLHPESSQRDRWLEQFPMNKVVELSHHQTKPNPEVLLEICADEGVPPDSAAYVGDSIARDVLMAKRAGVFAIWAAYGAQHSPDMYEALVRVSHWTPEEVERELRLKKEASTIQPDYVALSSFAEVAIALEINLSEADPD